MTDNELLLAISEMIEPLREDIREIKIRVKNIELNQENKIVPRLNTIESCYTSTFDKYKDNVEDYETMKQLHKEYYMKSVRSIELSRALHFFILGGQRK